MSMSAGAPAKAMAGMSMSHGPHMAAMAMGGMSMSAPTSGTTNILPDWLAVLWTLAFVALLVIHGRHVRDTRGERQWWHSGHVLMAVGMVFMFAPASIDHFNVPAGFWQLLFANAAGAALAYVFVQLCNGRTVNLLWLVMAFDFIAMTYMWSPSGFVRPIPWLLVAWFAGQALLWVTDRARAFDGRAIGLPRQLALAGGPVAEVVGEGHLICERDLRGSMFVMTLGMAYMFAAMQLLM
ncbi:MAG TPA: DUF5134 domain-containing protein [Solirubrobacteraceae bacterium]|nr:DUF5134 domain-containing protein [Solirubrobacteraceae bacterium]